MKSLTILAIGATLFFASCEQCFTCRYASSAEQEFCSADPGYIDDQEEACTSAGGVIL